MKPETLWRGYRGERQLPLRTYAGVVLIFNAILGLTAYSAIRKRPAHQESVGERVFDLLVLGTAVHKLSRVITREAVTAPFRAPFTRFREFLGYGEVLEESRGGPVRATVGDLVSCNYCADMWVGLGFLNLERLSPELARYLARFFAAVAFADFLHVSYETTRTQENVLTLHEERLEEKKSNLSA